jgi:elongation factor 1-beta
MAKKEEKKPIKKSLSEDDDEDTNPNPVIKSLIIFEVKPYDAETNNDELA